MSLEVRPFGVACNLGCQYCYQNVHRDAGNIGNRYDLELLKQKIEKKGAGFHLFGGEPLLMPEADLEDLWCWGYERFGENGLQTNGVLLNARHLEMIRKYKVRVGISVDGPGELNDVRWAGSLEKTRAATAKTEAAIQMLCEAGLPPGIMIQVSRCNASPQRIPQLHAWVRKLDQMGVTSARLHILEIENPEIRKKYGLSLEENIEILSSFIDLEKELIHLSFDITGDMKNLLQGNDSQTPCVWRACDPYTTEAVDGINGDGTRHNCGLTDKEGIHFQKPDLQGFERYLALYHTPQAYGGCQGCRFFLVCKGQCPGTAIDKDWRNRTEYCAVWMRLFEQMESELLKEGKIPVSLSSQRDTWETQYLEAWAIGSNMIFEIDIKTEQGV